MTSPQTGRRGFESLLVAVLLAMLALLQRQIWWSRDSVSANLRLARRIRGLETRLKADRFRDDLLHAEVRNLERGRGALAAAVRYNLGYVRPGERFYQVMIETSPAKDGPRTQGARSRHGVPVRRRAAPSSSGGPRT